MSNKERVQQIFDAFERGDIEFILNQLADDIEWTNYGTEELPHAGTFHGKAGVVQYFTTLDNTFVFENFHVNEFLDAGEAIVVLGVETVRSKSTGRATDNQWAMVFFFANDKVTRFLVYESSAALLKTLQPAA
jgi:hypothetical protein